MAVQSTVLATAWLLVYIFVPACAASHVLTRSQAVARIANRTAKNCRGHVIGHAHFQENYLCACSAFPLQSGLPKFEVSSSSSFGDMFDRIPKIVVSRDLGHAHFQGKLFVRPLGILDTKLQTKFEVSSSSSFRDIAL